MQTYYDVITVTEKAKVEIEIPTAHLKAARLMSEKLGQGLEEYIQECVWQGVGADIGNLEDDYGMEKIPILFSPQRFTWIKWLSTVQGYSNVTDFIIRALGEYAQTMDFTDKDHEYLNKLEEEAGIPDLSGFKAEVKALLETE